jgi:hypothetical protein
MAWIPTTPDWVDFPSTTTAIDAVDLDNFNAGLIGTNNDLRVLRWNGSTYLPPNGDASAKVDTSKPRRFVGPVDPATLSDIVTTELDEWGQYT